MHSPNIQKALDALIDERDHHLDQARWLDERIAEFSHNGAEPEPVPVVPFVRHQSVPRVPRSQPRDGDTAQRIVDYLVEHPQSTAGKIAKELDMKRNSVSTKLTQMAKAGQIKKEIKGYSA